ncbi:muconate cycloisomerase I, MLE [Pochonia chlamydosporia 170]|uniref:Muconate cycloisomerase I, MLE n=1 Tax=Pochonia chlamydosporia 170 TaxID=1380566 RepID=A0A179FVG4_METCM|nr:muconate cycloisomerase I, MLE [Pochonia chlamydosporia 170]OAQ69228.1 muconate cycloisomerase I, MLE [Pochonia chlamydosporia 170]
MHSHSTQEDPEWSTASADCRLDFHVGSFNVPYIFTLQFNPSNNQLSVSSITNATGPHSWLSLSPDQRTLYATAWTEPISTIAAYRSVDSGDALQLLGSKPVRNKPGYVSCSDTHIYCVGGNTGEVFRVDRNGGIGDLVQELDFAIDEEHEKPDTGASRHSVPHGDFGGLRHGAHGCDLSHDEKALFVADIGRNCTWSFSVNKTEKLVLQDQQKHVAPRADDGPRHVWPHPNGKVLYVVQEHSSIVDVFYIQRDRAGVVKSLNHAHGASLLPEGECAAHYWADEVRLSTESNPRYLFASTRGLESHTNGYVCVFGLNQNGTLTQTVAIDIWETPTSGGIANAIEPAPWSTRVSQACPSKHFIAMTDSEACKVFILSFDGKTICMVNSTVLEVPMRNQVGQKMLAQPATAIWVRPKA